MTCIVGVEAPDGVYIGGDSAVIAGWSLNSRDIAKVFRVGEFLFGVAGSIRVLNLLRYRFEPPELPDAELTRYMTVDWVDALRECMAAGGAGRKDDEVETLNSHMLVGVRGRLYVVHGDYQVVHANGYAAIGCADNAALGALYVLTQKKRGPRRIVTNALAAAEAHNVGVRGPFVVECLPSA